MWVARELSRLLLQIVLAVAICTAIAGMKAVVSNGFRIPGVPVPTEGPTLTTSAVFIGSGIALLALGIFV